MRVSTKNALAAIKEAFSGFMFIVEDYGEEELVDLNKLGGLGEELKLTQNKVEDNSKAFIISDEKKPKKMKLNGKVDEGKARKSAALKSKNKEKNEKEQDK